jgi:hypothetical protein
VRLDACVLVQLLCLCLPSTPSDFMGARDTMRLGLSIKCQWIVLDLNKRTVTEMEVFKPR